MPVIVITTVVGTTIFGTLDQNPDPRWRILAGLVSLAGAVLSALQTSLAFAQRAEKHKAAGEMYRGMRRKFELFYLRYSQVDVDQPAAAMEAMEALCDELGAIAKEFPAIPERCYARAEAEQTAYEKRFSKSDDRAEISPSGA